MDPYTIVGSTAAVLGGLALLGYFIGKAFFPNDMSWRLLFALGIPLAGVMLGAADFITYGSYQGAMFDYDGAHSMSPRDPRAGAWR